MNLTTYLIDSSKPLYRANLGTRIGVLVASQGSQGTTIQVGILLGQQVQVIGVLYMSGYLTAENLESLGTSPPVNLASQDITTLRLGAHIRGRSLHGHIHHGQLIG